MPLEDPEVLARKAASLDMQRNRFRRALGGEEDEAPADVPFSVCFAFLSFADEIACSCGVPVPATRTAISSYSLCSCAAVMCFNVSGVSHDKKVYCRASAFVLIVQLKPLSLYRPLHNDLYIDFVMHLSFC